MLKDSKLVAFSATAKPDESKVFYQSVLGLSLLEDSPYALVFDVNNTQLRIQKVSVVTPRSYTALGWTVTDIEARLGALAEHGIACEFFSGMQQDQHSIWTTPDGSKVAWFRDPDGNILSITEYATR